MSSIPPPNSLSLKKKIVSVQYFCRYFCTEEHVTQIGLGWVPQVVHTNGHPQVSYKAYLALCTPSNLP